MSVYLGNIEIKLSSSSSGGSGSGGSSGGDTSSYTYPDDAIDLGLPSGIRWATANWGVSGVTRSADSTDIGYYVQHGNQVGGSANDAKYWNWSDTDCNGGSESVFLDAIQEWDETYTAENSDTAAYNLTLETDCVNLDWGSGWRIPTQAECIELISNTTITQVTVNTVKCWKLTNKSDSSKYILLPRAGYLPCGTASSPALTGSGMVAAYWSSTVCAVDGSDDEQYAYCMQAISTLRTINASRAWAMPIRPVYDPTIA